MTRRDATTHDDAASDEAVKDAAKAPAKESKKASAATGSEVELQLAALEALAEQLKVQVSYEPMTGVVSGAGGLCRLKGSYRVIIDRRLKPRERAQILSDALRRFDLDRVELSPEVRPWVGPSASPPAEA